MEKLKKEFYWEKVEEKPRNASFWLVLLRHKTNSSFWCLTGCFVACPNAELLGTQHHEGQKWRHLYPSSISSTKQKLGRDFLQNSFPFSRLRLT